MHKVLKCISFFFFRNHFVLLYLILSVLQKRFYYIYPIINIFTFFRSRGYTKNWSESERSIRNLSVIVTSSGTCSRRRNTRITFTSSRQQLLQQPPQLPSPHRQRTAGSSWHPLTPGKVTNNLMGVISASYIYSFFPTPPSFRKVMSSVLQRRENILKSDENWKFNILLKYAISNIDI